MKKFYLKIANFFRTNLYKIKDRRMSMKELVSSISIYEKRINVSWRELSKIINKYEKGETKETEFIKNFKEDYNKIASYENELILLKVIQLRKNSGSFFNSKQNRSIVQLSALKKRVIAIDELLEYVEHISSNLNQFLLDEKKKYLTIISNIKISLDIFNDKCVTLPFVPSLAPKI